MWICANDGFVSVVADNGNPARLMVRARRKQDLQNVCGLCVEVIENAGSDYRWRAFVDRKAFAALVAERVENIEYTNFKNSVADHDLHELYMRFWELHHRYQEQKQKRSNVPTSKRAEFEDENVPADPTVTPDLLTWGPAATRLGLTWDELYTAMAQVTDSKGVVVPPDNNKRLLRLRILAEIDKMSGELAIADR
jgi:hypothetical protein